MDLSGMLLTIVDHNPVDLVFGNHYRLAVAASVVMLGCAVLLMAARDHGPWQFPWQLATAGCVGPLAAVIGLAYHLDTSLVMATAAVVAVLMAGFVVWRVEEDKRMPRKRSATCMALLAYAALMAAFGCELAQATVTTSDHSLAQGFLYYLVAVFMTVTMVLAASCLLAWARNVNQETKAGKRAATPSLSIVRP
jgi:hypothetical protein